MRTPLLILLLASLPALAAIEPAQFADPSQQAAYDRLTYELRCLVCQNQNIADSNAELAADLRRQVREMLLQGRSEDDIVRFMTERYGDFVLYKPPLASKTALLWAGPALLLVAGLAAAFHFIRRQRQPPPTPDDPERLAAIRRLLDTGDRR